MVKYSILLLSLLIITLYSIKYNFQLKEYVSHNISTFDSDEEYTNRVETQMIQFEKDFTHYFFDAKAYEKHENYQKIKETLGNREGVIIVCKDFIYDENNHINYVFIPLKNSLLENINMNDEQYLLQIRSSQKILPIVSGDKEYFQFVREWASMQVEYDLNKSYHYFPLYSLTKETLKDNSAHIYIPYNMSFDEINILNSLHDIYLGNNYSWKEKEIISIREVKMALELS